jgi:hypothetical protein
VFDTQNGKMLATIPMINDCETVWFDPNTQRAYGSCGMGTIDVFRQGAEGKFELEARIPTATGARISYFSPTLRRFYTVSPGTREDPKGVIRVYESEAGASASPESTPAAQPATQPATP